MPHRPIQDLAGQNRHVGGPPFSPPDHTSLLLHSLLEKTATEQCWLLLDLSLRATARSANKPNDIPHTLLDFFTNPVALNNPFHDKITFNYLHLLLLNLYSDNDTISQIFRLSGHMWQINLKLKPKPTQPTYNYTSYFLYFILPYCRRNTLRARRPFLRRISDFLQTNRN